MKTKLKSILQNAWHEPRHFFFWLALLSLCGLAILAISLALIPYEVQKSRPGVLLSFLMLGCMLLFVTSFPAFFLALIIPSKMENSESSASQARLNSGCPIFS